MSYRAIEVTAPGRLTLVTRTASEPDPGEVLLAVEACGICGADRRDIDGGVIGRVPGHEVVGRILAVGAGVPPIWRIGQRVGVGRFGGHCETCPACRAGQFHLCRQQPVTGSSCDGSYAERMA
jgi:alcohol dehydrogenase